MLLMLKSFFLKKTPLFFIPELYVFLSSLVLEFDVCLPCGEKPSLEWGRPVLPHPKPFDVKLTPIKRNNKA